MTSPAAPRLASGQYQLDPLRTDIRFRIRDWFGLLPVTGSFTLEHGTVTLTEPDPEDAVPGCTADLSIAAASFTTGNRARDRQVRNRRFLHTAVHPSIEAHIERLNALSITSSRGLASRWVDVTIDLTAQRVVAE